MFPSNFIVYGLSIPTTELSEMPSVPNILCCHPDPHPPHSLLPLHRDLPQLQCSTPFYTRDLLATFRHIDNKARVGDLCLLLGLCFAGRGNYDWEGRLVVGY